MPGPHMPPMGPVHPHHNQHQPHHQGRRPDHAYHYPYPPQTHSPVHPNPYVTYHHPHPFAPAHGYPQHMQQMPQWFPYQQQAMPPHPQQYPLPPRQFQPHMSPVVVSSQFANGHMHMPSMNRPDGHTPPIAHSRTSSARDSVPPVYTPQRLPSTPSAPSQTPLPASTPPTSSTADSPQPKVESKEVVTALASPPRPTCFKPFYPPLPWYSNPGEDFPKRAPRRRKRLQVPVDPQEQSLALPPLPREQAQKGEGDNVMEDLAEGEQTPTEGRGESQASTIAGPSDIEVDTPSTSHPPSEIDVAQPAVTSTISTPVPSVSKHTRSATKPAVPIIPVKPPKPASTTSTTQKSTQSPSSTPNELLKQGQEISSIDTPKSSHGVSEGSIITPQAKPPPPKSWAELLRAKAASSIAEPTVIPNGAANTNGIATTKSNNLADILASFAVDSQKKIAFLEPRGLVNTGNLCYMNSILQVLLFCIPFYDFLDQVANRAVHNFKSETPLVDAMIMFMRDFKTIDSASSVEQLRLRLKQTELEQYGDPLTPEYVYDVIKRLPRFDNMKRGQQEDAEEFLGFLLAGLHDECAQLIKSEKDSNTSDISSPSSEASTSVNGGWHEVGPKQKTAVTQSSGTIEVESPITKIFGGKLRSEYKKPNEKPSVTFEPYQPLQLDIHEPNINNISDALKNLTRLETLDGAARGTRASTKQVHIETLPPVLILHLKRFHYDEKGPQKIWKKVGYPLELEIPKEVFPAHKRGSYQLRGGFPRYRLTGVVYHHGKNASGGHYTVDLRRQEGKEWIRMDDTVIRRIHADDVAEGGAGEDPKVLAAALEQHKNDAGKTKNFFAQIESHEVETDKGGWNQVNGADKKDNSKKWSGVVNGNGAATPNSAGKRTPLPRDSVRDNKVAYILFYQRVG